jgi:uncharacterized membrane protein YjjP (DUF1212 family)
MTAESGKPDTDALLEFMFRLGRAYLACGEQTAKVEVLLRRAAAAYGMRNSRVVTFPTAVFIALHDGEQERVTLGASEPQTLRLDQMADVYALGEAAQRAEVTPAGGLERLAVILQQSPRFGARGVIVGHTILTLGLAMVLMPTLTNVGAAAVLGASIGAVKLLNRGRGIMAMPLPVVAAASVSALVFLAVNHGLPVDPLHVLVPPLVTFLPGAMLTLGMVELAYGDMVSGSSRLIAGLVQLVLLTFGLAAGAAVVGYSPEYLLQADALYHKVAWAGWVGVFVFGYGVYLHFSAPRNSFRWMLLVLLMAFVTQRIAAGAFGSAISGFFGTLVVTPLSYLIQLRFGGPPATVTFLPAFWLRVQERMGPDAPAVGARQPIMP